MMTRAEMARTQAALAAAEEELAARSRAATEVGPPQAAAQKQLED